MVAKTAYLFVNANNAESVEYFIAKGKRIVKNGVTSIKNIDDLKVDHLRISLLSDLSYFDIVQLKISSKKFLNIAVRRFIDGLSVFTEPYSARYKLLNKHDREMSTSITAVPKSDINALFQSIDNQSVIIDSVTLVENVIANLLEKMNIHPHKIMWAKFGFLSEIIVEKGNIRSRNLSKYNPEQARSLAEEGTLLMGDLADKNEEITKWRRNILGASIGEIMHSPELYGLFFLDKNFNFLENDYLTKTTAYRFSKLTAVISVVLSLFLTTVSVRSYLNYSKIRKIFNSKLLYLSSENSKLQAGLPNMNEISTLEKLSKLQNKLNKELDLGRFIGWLSNIMPSDTLINSIDITPNLKAATSKRLGRSPVLQTKPDAKEFTAKIDVSIQGDYKSAKHKMVIFLKELSARTMPKQSVFNYTNSDKSAQFSTILTIDGSRF